MKDYYNILEFDKANDLKWINPELSLKLFQEYFIKYPKDYTSYPFYIDLLINLNYLNKAKDIRNKVIKMVMNDHKFQSNIGKLTRFKYGVVYNELRLLILEGDYEQALNHVIKYEKLLMNIDKDFTIGGIVFFCKKRLGLLDINRRDDYSYLFRQMLDYQEEDFTNHIKKHLSCNDEENLCVFDKNFPFDMIFQEIKKLIPNNKRLRSGVYDDKYFFKYDNCGRCNYKITDYFEIIVLNDSSDFITMYPTNISNDVPHIDLNYLNKENVKEKRISQIDKFYQRYQKK